MHLKNSMAILLSLCILGCAPKAVDMASLRQHIDSERQSSIAVYDTDNDRIVFYTFFKKDGILVEKSWAKMLPFRVEFMDLWVSGLGHDLRRLTQNEAETIKDALMYAAKKEGLKPLHVNQNDYIIEGVFAQEMVNAIEAYEEKMRRYERDKRFPLVPLPLL